VHPAEVTDAGDRDAHESVVELPHPVAAHRDLHADRVAFAELEPRDGLLRASYRRFLPGDDGEVVDRAVEERRLLGGATHAAVHDDLLEPRHLHDVPERQLGLQLPTQLLEVARLEPRHGARRCGRGHQTSPPHFLHTRTLLPSSSTRYPTRVGPHDEHTSATFEMSIGMSLSMIPPCIVARVARW